MNISKYLMVIVTALGALYHSNLTALQINKVIIWGHKLHTHTHSYIHYGAYKAFKELGYDVYWFDDKDHPSNKKFDYSQSLFFTAANVENKIPVRDDCYYVYHHCWNKTHRCFPDKYKSVFGKNRAILIKCFWQEYLQPDPEWTCVDKCIYKNVKNKEIVFPWATDLLPYEIDEQIANITWPKQSKTIVFLGTISNVGYGANQKELDPFFKAAKENNCVVVTNDPWSKPIGIQEHIKKIQNAFIAPAIQGQWQVDVGYIPCRIFKNISYGQMGITNSKFVDDLFDHQIVYNSDTRQLFYDALDEINHFDISKQIRLMNFIKEKHTYINRVQLILDFFMELNNEK